MKAKNSTGKTYLSSQMANRSSNLELMKFLAAMFVIINHAFDLTLDGKERLSVITNGQIGLSGAAVSFFFFASGLFIAKSAERSKTCKDFAKARFVRIWPSLFVVVSFCIFAGVFFTALQPGDYFLNINTWKYYLNAFFVLQHNLPGVFLDNVARSAVNGALWTLPVEVLCYVACYIIYKLKLLEKRKILYLMALYLVCAVIGSHLFSVLGISLLSAALRPCYFFLLGHVLYVYRDKVVLDIRLFIGAWCGMILCFALSWPVLAIWGFFPYILLYLAFMTPQCGKKLSIVGRYSYTIYLCAFPIQQAIICLHGGVMNAYVNMLESMVCALILGVLLHHLVEEPVIRFVNQKNV